MKNQFAGTVVYGTSDHFLNFGEVLLTSWAAAHLGGQPVFFYYPKSLIWLRFERSLFEPYRAPGPPPSGLLEAGLGGVLLSPIQQILPSEDTVWTLPLYAVAGKIKEARQIQSFLAATVKAWGGMVETKVYATKKDHVWRDLFAGLSMSELLGAPEVKAGGSILYFLYGYSMGRTGAVGILPGKQASDILGAFEAGRAAAGGGGRIVHTGEFDFMTARQWSLWKSDHCWRKAPPWAVRRLIDSPSAEEVRRRLLVGEYCPLAYDEEADNFFFVDI